MAQYMVDPGSPQAYIAATVRTELAAQDFVSLNGYRPDFNNPSDQKEVTHRANILSQRYDFDYVATITSTLINLSYLTAGPQALLMEQFALLMWEILGPPDADTQNPPELYLAAAERIVIYLKAILDPENFLVPIEPSSTVDNE